MQRKLNQDDFEQFLKESTEGLQLKPSPAVWQSLSRELNRKKRRFTGLLALAIGISTAGYFSWYAFDVPAENATPAAGTATDIPTAAGPASTPVAEMPLNNQTADYNAPVRSAEAKVIKISTLARRKTVAATQTQPIPDPAFVAAVPFETTLTDEGITHTGNPETDASATSLEQITREVSEPIATLSLERGPLPQGSLPEAAPLEQPATETQPPALALTSQVSESIAASLKKTNRRLNWTFFITPTISYRKLADNKGFERPFLTPGTPPMVSALYNVKDAVIHKPDLGMEFGTMARYALSKKVKFRTGFQFNISRYEIKAFSYVPEVATIALNNGVRVDSLRAMSSYRNYSAGRSNWLQNFYFQASLPIGMELKMLGNDKLQWSVASSVQPTFLLGNRAYMITADYKNYARVPWLTRHWNLNTSMETFVTYNTGKTEWHVGPQVRYQLLSSFVQEYPVKEYLFDFGLKVGVTLK